VPPLDHLVGVDVLQTQPLGEQAPDGRLACAHKASEHDVVWLANVGHTPSLGTTARSWQLDCYVLMSIRVEKRIVFHARNKSTTDMGLGKMSTDISHKKKTSVKLTAKEKKQAQKEANRKARMQWYIVGAMTALLILGAILLVLLTTDGEIAVYGGNYDR